MKYTTEITEYKKIAQKLRQARMESKLTQVQVAIKLKKPQSFMSKIESGEQKIDVIELKNLSKLYGKDLDFFI